MGLYIRVKYGNFELILYLSVLCCSVRSYQLIHSRTRIYNEIVGKRGTARRKKMECSIGDWRKERIRASQCQERKRRQNKRIDKSVGI